MLLTLPLLFCLDERAQRSHVVRAPAPLSRRCGSHCCVATAASSFATRCVSDALG